MTSTGEPTGGPAGDTARRLRAAVDAVTLEDFRLEDARIERDARLGRRLLHLLCTDEWLRRTSENVGLRSMRVVDTEVVVDVDLSFVTAAALEGPGPVWLPLLAVPAPARVHVRRTSDALTSMEVTDAAGARVQKLPQSDVHRRLGAAVAELFLGRLPGPARKPRDELVLLAAAVRRLLGAALEGPGGGAGDAGAVPVGGQRAGDRLAAAQEGLRRAFAADPQQPRPVLTSRLPEMLEALLGTVLVVVPVDRATPPTSFAVRLPGRRLRPSGGLRALLDPGARLALHVDLVTASAHADRLVRLALPEGVGTVRRHEARRDTAGRIRVTEPRPLAELRALTTLVVAAQDGVGGWVQRKLADVAVEKVGACRELFAHYRIPDDDLSDTGTADVLRRLAELGALLEALAAGGRSPEDVTVRLAGAWDDGAWLPRTLDRRIVVNRATPGVILLRATTIEGWAQRGTTAEARLQVWIEPSDSSVLETAQDTNRINFALLVLVAVILAVAGDGFDRQVLATVLTIFPAIQASRLDRPDRATLRGRLALPVYTRSLLTVFPPLLLATLLALDTLPHEGVLAVGAVPSAASVAVLVAVLQALLYLSLARLPGGGRTAPRATAPRRELRTERPPDLSRLDVLRGAWCRSLVSDALLLGRRASAWVAVAPDAPGTLLAALDAGGRGAPAARSVQGVLHAVQAGSALTFVVATGPGAGGSERTRSSAGTRALVLDPGRLAPNEPPAWIVELLVGMPPALARDVPVGEHPLVTVAEEAGESGYNVIFAQAPTTPPPVCRDDRVWMRARIGVPFPPRETLAGLQRFLTEIQRRIGTAGGPDGIEVRVRVIPEFAAYEAAETTPDDAARGTGDGLGAAGPPRPVTTADVDGLGMHDARPLALFAPSRPGLLAAVLGALGTARPEARLAGVTVAGVHGLGAFLLFVRGAGPGAGRAVREALRGQHDVQVGVEDGDLDGTNSRAAPAPRRLEAPGTTPGAGAATDAGARTDAGALLSLEVRTPERPQALRGVLARIEATTRVEAAEHGVGPELLQAWFALFRVTEGRTLQGRVVVRLPFDGSTWDEDEWTADWDALPDPAGTTADGTPGPADDDEVVTADLLRTRPVRT